MIRIWKSSFGERRLPPGIPRPVAFLEDNNALVMERIAGYPMIEWMGAGVERIEEVARTLADLHTSDASPSKRRDAKRVVRSIQRKVADLTGTGVEHHLTQVAKRLEEWLPEVNRGEHGPVELVPSHGDFSPRNVILSPERIAFIDWDRFRLADPARDLAYFGAWAWMSDLRLSRKPDWTLGDRLVDIYQAYHPTTKIEVRIKFYRAAGLARIAHSQVRLWKSTDLVLPLTSEALRLLA
jgi:aminoglycoside phosphotransferase (APT) family kinase protein